MSRDVLFNKIKYLQTNLSLGYLLCLILLVGFNYYPALDNNFVYWDDQYYVLENIWINQPTMEHLKELCFQIISLNYHPITMFSLWLNAFFSGTESAFSFIATNLFFHVLNTCLVFSFVKKISQGNAWLAFVTALIFGIHPMHVESVAWVSERKDVLYSFFFLSASIMYLKYLDKKTFVYYAICFLLFLLACGAKAMAVVFVPIMLLIDFYQKRTWKQTRLYFEKIPFLILALLAGWIALDVQAGNDFYGYLESSVNVAAIGDSKTSYWGKLGIASYGLYFYLEKFFLPFELAALHPYENVLNSPFYPYFPFFGLTFLGVLIWSFFRYPKIAFGLSFFLLTLLLVLQFIPVGTAIVAERYSYLPYLGLGYLLGLSMEKWLGGKSRKTWFLVTILITGYLSIHTRIQTDVWQDDISLFENTVAIYPQNPYAREYLSTALWLDGDVDNAIYHLEYAINDLRYTDASSIAQLGVYFNEKGAYEESLSYLNQAVALDSTNTLIRFNRALTLVSVEPKLAIDDLDFCENSKDENILKLIYEPRARCYGMLGNYEKSVLDFTKALEISSEKEWVYYNRAVSYEKMGRVDLAIEDYESALELNKEMEDAKMRLALLKRNEK